MIVGEVVKLHSQVEIGLLPEPKVESDYPQGVLNQRGQADKIEY